MEIGSIVRFIKDIKTQNGKNNRAKIGDVGRVVWVAHDGYVTVRRDGKAHMIHDVNPKFLEVIQ